MSETRDLEPASIPIPAATSAAAGRHVIAAIGIDRYHHWKRLSNAEHDARGAVALFEQLGFEEIAAPLLGDAATGRAIDALVMDDLRKLAPEDSLVLFYAGHGGTRRHRVGDEEVKTGYLIPVDASASPDEAVTWIELESWLRAVSLLPPMHILVILDACHSGFALDPTVKWRDGGASRELPLSTLRMRRSRRIITSALDDQLAMDSGPVHGHSLFTGCLIEAFTGGIRSEGRRAISGSELGLYVQQRVEQYPRSRQTPDFGSFDFDDRGEMVIPLASPETSDAPEGEREAPEREVPEREVPGRKPPEREVPEREAPWWRALWRRPPWRRARVATVAAGLAVAFALAFVLLGALRDPPKHAGVDVERAPAAAPATPNTPVAPAAPIDAPAASGDAPAAPAAPGVSGDAPAAAPASAAAPAKLPAPLVVPNQWVRIDPPPVPYRLGVADTAPPQQVGFRASRGILTPSRSYEIHEHEVTWSELEPWLEPWLARRHEKVVFPSWATDPGERAGLPATGIKWDTALEYCRSLGGQLPTEEQWEYAARGAEQRPNPWGADPLDRQITNAYAGPNAQPWPAIWSRQDRTPYRPRVYDLAGNVQEWTLGLWREDRPGKEESSASVGQTTSRAIRGLPLAEPPPPSIQPAASAYRERLCATGPCVEKTRKRLAYIGFRCARPLD